MEELEGNGKGLMGGARESQGKAASVPGRFRLLPRGGLASGSKQPEAAAWRTDLGPSRCGVRNPGPCGGSLTTRPIVVALPAAATPLVPATATPLVPVP